MAGPATRNLKDTITYWAPAGLDRYQVLSFDIPQVYKGRWTAENKEVTSDAGEQLVSSTQVAVPIEMVTGGYLAEGSHLGVADPRSVGGKEIQAFMSTPDLRSLEQRRVAFL